MMQAESWLGASQQKVCLQTSRRAAAKDAQIAGLFGVSEPSFRQPLDMVRAAPSLLARFHDEGIVHTLRSSPVSGV
jgi:hypothetical protein